MKWVKLPNINAIFILLLCGFYSHSLSRPQLLVTLQHYDDIFSGENYNWLVGAEYKSYSFQIGLFEQFNFSWDSQKNLATDSTDTKWGPPESDWGYSNDVDDDYFLLSFGKSYKGKYFDQKIRWLTAFAYQNAIGYEVSKPFEKVSIFMGWYADFKYTTIYWGSSGQSAPFRKEKNLSIKPKLLVGIQLKL